MIKIETLQLYISVCLLIFAANTFGKYKKPLMTPYPMNEHYTFSWKEDGGEIQAHGIRFSFPVQDEDVALIPTSESYDQILEIIWQSDKPDVKFQVCFLPHDNLDQSLEWILDNTDAEVEKIKHTFGIVVYFIKLKSINGQTRLSVNGGKLIPECSLRVVDENGVDANAVVSLEIYEKDKSIKKSNEVASKYFDIVSIDTESHHNDASGFGPNYGDDDENSYKKDPRGFQLQDIFFTTSIYEVFNRKEKRIEVRKVVIAHFNGQQWEVSSNTLAQMMEDASLMNRSPQLHLDVTRTRATKTKSGEDDAGLSISLPVPQLVKMAEWLNRWVTKTPDRIEIKSYCEGQIQSALLEYQGLAVVAGDDVRSLAERLAKLISQSCSSENRLVSPEIHQAGGGKGSSQSGSFQDKTRKEAEGKTSEGNSLDPDGTASNKEPSKNSNSNSNEGDEDDEDEKELNPGSDREMTQEQRKRIIEHLAKRTKEVDADNKEQIVSEFNTRLKYLTRDDIDMPLEEGKSLLHLVIRNIAGDYEQTALRIVSLLIEHGASPRSLDDNSDTPLHEAARAGVPSVIKLLFEGSLSKEEVDSQNRKFDTPLHLAVRGNHLSTVRELLSQDASQFIYNASGTEGFYPIHYAAGAGYLPILKALYEAAPQAAHALTSSTYSSCLHWASKYNRVEAMNYLINTAGVSVDLKSSEDYTSLHIAAASGNVDAVRVLLDKGASLSVVASSGHTTRDLASQYGHSTIMNLFLETGAKEEDIHGAATIEYKRKSYHATNVDRLFLAIKNGHADMVEVLLKQGAVHPDLVLAETNMSALYLAVHVAIQKRTENSLTIVKALLKYEPNFSIKNSSGETALRLALRAKKPWLDVVKALISGGADIDKIVWDEEFKSEASECQRFFKLLPRSMMGYSLKDYSYRGELLKIASELIRTTKNDPVRALSDFYKAYRYDTYVLWPELQPLIAEMTKRSDELRSDESACNIPKPLVSQERPRTKIMASIAGALFPKERSRAKQGASGAQNALEVKENIGKAVLPFAQDAGLAARQVEAERAAVEKHPLTKEDCFEPAISRQNNKPKSTASATTAAGIKKCGVLDLEKERARIESFNQFAQSYQKEQPANLLEKEAEKNLLRIERSLENANSKSAKPTADIDKESNKKVKEKKGKPNAALSL